MSELKLKTVCCFFLLIFLTVPGIARAKRVTVNVSTANVRSGPGTEYKVLWKVEKYHPFEVLEVSGSWYRCSDFEGDKGWVSKDTVGDFPAVIIKKDNCNVREGPGSGFKTLFTVERGVPFREVKREGEWIFVVHTDGDKGWINMGLVW